MAHMVGMKNGRVEPADALPYRHASDCPCVDCEARRYRHAAPAHLIGVRITRARPDVIKTNEATDNTTE